MVALQTVNLSGPPPVAAAICHPDVLGAGIPTQSRSLSRSMMLLTPQRFVSRCERLEIRYMANPTPIVLWSAQRYSARRKKEDAGRCSTARV